MARTPKPVRDLDSSPHLKRIPQSFLSSYDTVRSLEELVRLMELHKNIEPKVTKAALKLRYQNWLKNGMSKEQHRSFSTRALEASISNAHEYALTEFKNTLEPHELDVFESGVGRPPGYLAPSVKRKILTGDVIGMLLNIGYHQLRSQLEEKKDAA